MKSLNIYKTLRIRSLIFILFSLFLLQSGFYQNNSFAQAIPNLGDIQAIEEIMDANGIYNFPTGMFGYQKWNSSTGRLEKLIITNYEIEVIPEEIKNLDHLQYLDLSYNTLLSFPVTLTKLSNLDTLILTGNQIQDIPNEIANLSDLKCLILDQNSIISLPGTFVYLKNLKRLSLGLNKIRQLPEFYYKLYVIAIIEDYIHFSNLENLEYLNLSGNPISLKSEDFYYDGKFGNVHLGNLKELHIDGAKLRSLPWSISLSSNLEILTLSYDSLLVLPNEIGDLRNLKTLNLDSSYISSLPSNFFNLTNLRELTLSNNPIKSLPAGLGKNNKMKYLNIANTRLKELPDDIANMDSLQILIASGNLLTKFNLSGNRIKRSISINLSKNRLVEVSERISEFDSLVNLNLSFNKLKSLPSSIGRLYNTQNLSVFYNELEELPSEFGNMGSNLKILDLRFNKLKRLPANFGNLKGLVNLSLQYNYLESLPENYGDLSLIKVLDLSYNNLKSLPESFNKLKIVNLILTANQLTDLPHNFGTLDSLVICQLDSNKLSSVPMSLLNFRHILANLNLAHNYISAIPDTFSNLMVVNLDVTGNNLYCEDGLQNTSVIPGFLKTGNPFPVHVTGLYNQRCFTPENLTDREHYRLYEPFPNPFNPSTNIHFYVPKNGNVDLSVYNILGQKVATIYSGYLERGYYRDKWITGRISSGMYIVGLKSDEIFLTQKLLLIK